MSKQEWKDLKTLQEVAQAQADGWEIECKKCHEGYYNWDGKTWYMGQVYRARPKQLKMKQVMLREALFKSQLVEDYYWTDWVSDEHSPTFIRWLDTPERVVEVPEND